MTKIVINLIKLYQHLGRFILRNGQLPILIYADCKFQPTCSDYAIGAVSKYGVVRGLIKASLRILKCNPLTQGGIEHP